MIDTTEMTGEMIDPVTGELSIRRYLRNGCSQAREPAEMILPGRPGILEGRRIMIDLLVGLDDLCWVCRV